MTRAIVYSCPFVPAEWIAAHGLRPRRIMPRSTSAGSSIDPVFGVCTYARAFIRAAASDTEAAAVVVTTVCDQMRRVPELIARRREIPVFLMNVPSTWETPAAHRLYRGEVERLGRFMVRMGGRAPLSDELAAVMLEFDERRASIRAARDGFSPRRYSEMIASFHRNDEPVAGERTAGILPAMSRLEACGTGVPLALIGGPMLREDLVIFDFVEKAGGRIVLDGTETGERTLPAPFERRQVRDDPLAELTRAYFRSIPDASRRPNSELYKWLRRQIRERSIRGLIYRRHVWCDIWHAELHRLKEWVGLPVLDLAGGDDAEATRTRMAGRIQAFMEMLT
jgi:benzoyl-CoA reductase/2-hydroxyglutaryl-CoA dehydratase subunit BcrC/BadD/HgdB